MLRILCLLVGVGTAVAGGAGAQGPALVEDINKTAGPNLSSNPREFVTAGGYTYFAAFALATGTELYRTLGTPSSTQLVADINPGPRSSTPAELVALGSTVYFSAWDGSSGTELWKSDGTSAGTVLVQDIKPGALSGLSRPAYLTAVGNAVFFRADDGASGAELWKSDGTAAGTVLVRTSIREPQAPARRTSRLCRAFVASPPMTARRDASRGRATAPPAVP